MEQLLERFQNKKARRPSFQWVFSKYCCTKIPLHNYKACALPSYHGTRDYNNNIKACTIWNTYFEIIPLITLCWLCYRVAAPNLKAIIRHMAAAQSGDPGAVDLKGAQELIRIFTPSRSGNIDAAFSWMDPLLHIRRYTPQKLYLNKESKNSLFQEYTIIILLPFITSGCHAFRQILSV